MKYISILLVFVLTGCIHNHLSSKQRTQTPTIVELNESSSRTPPAHVKCEFPFTEEVDIFEGHRCVPPEPFEDFCENIEITCLAHENLKTFR